MKHFDFVTCFDSNYIYQGLVLFHSLKRLIQDFRFFVVALDEQCFQALTQLSVSSPEIVPVPLGDIEAYEPRLAEAQKNRSRIEYIFTLSPIIPLYLLEKFPDMEILNYLDSDLYFYSSPEPVYQEFQHYSVLITAHNFPFHLKFLERCGKYNMAFQLYRNNEECRTVLYDWREKCLDWCYDRVEKERYADQKYMDAWPLRWQQQVCVSKLPGVNVGPWNWMRSKLRIRNGLLFSGDSPVIFYHFQGIRFLTPNRFCHNLGCYFAVMGKGLRQYLYARYAREILDMESFLQQELPRFSWHIKFKNFRTNWISYLKNIIGFPVNTMTIAGKKES